MAIARNKKHHLSDTQIRAMVKVCKAESDFHRKSHSGHCKGLFQIWTHVGKHKWQSVTWNTNRACKYVRHRYRTWTLAWAFHKRHGWY